MESNARNNVDQDESQRRRLQEYLFGLEDIQEEAEALAFEHEQLKRSMELLIAVLSGTIHGICLIKDDKFAWCNQAMTDILGWSQDELVGRQTEVLYPSTEQHRKMISLIHDGLSRTGRVIFEHDFVDRNGRHIPCLATGRALDDRDLGKGYVFSVTDIIERRNAEEALRLAHDELEIRIGERTDELLAANLRLIGEVEARKKAEDELRRQNEYLAGLHETALGLVSSLEVGDLLEAIVARAAALVRTPHGFVYLADELGEDMELKVGIGFYAEHVGYHLKPGQGLAGKAFQMGKPMVVADYSRWEGRATDKRWEGVRSVVAVPLKSRSQVVGVIGLTHTDEDEDRPFEQGEVKVLGSFAELASIALDNARLYEALQQELKQRKFTERALKRSEEKFRSMVNQSTDCIYLVSPRTKGVVEANPALLHLLGYNHQEILELTIYDFDAQQPAEIDQKMARAMAAQDHFIGRRQYRTKSGRIVDVEVTANLVSYGKEELLCVVCRDTTERRKMDEEIMKADKLESVGLLAGGIAHDFNNILTAIMGNISIAKLKTKPPDIVYTRLDEAEKACSRAKDLTYQLLTFAKGGAPIKETTSVPEVIKESCTFTLAGSNVRCQYEIPDDVWPVEVDTSQISQVLSNMVLNAKQAMPEGGTIAITVRNTTMEETPRLPLKSGEYVRISIRDEGTGIPEKHLGRIFDPYFTTKQTGSGLGLATSYSIIRKHDGLIDVESQLGAGTTFHIYLPVSHREIRQDQPARSMPVRGRGKVLVMDDDDLIREIVEEMLLQLGYEAALASDGEQTVSLYKEAMRNGEPFDAVIMDLTIPGGMGGTEAVKALLHIDPTAVAIVSSGYSNDPVMSDFAQYGFKGIVTKPYNVKELGDILHKVLANR
jgi:PAS domain S-box-containing protein